MKFEIFLVLTGIYFLVELTVGIVFNSIILQADAFHMLSDFVALSIGYYSKRINKQTSDKHTYGYQRSEIIGGLINSTFLLALCFTLFIESIERLYSLREISDPFIVMYTGIGGLFVNLVGLFLFHHHDNHNSKAVFLHVLGDFLGSVAVIISMIFIILTDYSWKYYLDPIITILIIGILVFNSVKILRNTTNILLHKIPLEINIIDLEKKLLRVEGISSIKEFHIWSLNDKINVCSAHVSKNEKNTTINILNESKKILHENGIHSSSLQITGTDYVEFICEDNCKPCCVKENEIA